MRRWMCLLSVPAFLAAAPPAREMSFKTPDGFVIKGTLTLPEGKGKKPVVILAHQFKSDRKGWDALATELHARGMGTLALDLRGHGESAERSAVPVKVTDDFAASAKAAGFDQIPSDLVLAAEWLRKQPGVHPKRVGLAGASVGAYAVLAAAPQVHPYAVLALSPAGNVAFGDKAAARLVEAARKANTAVFVVSSEDDGEAAENLKVLKALPGVHAQLLKGRDHGMAYLAERKDTMAVFFGEYLNHPHMAAKPAVDRPAPAPGEAALKEGEK